MWLNPLPWCCIGELNPEPPCYEHDALPIELMQQGVVVYLTPQPYAPELPGVMPHYQCAQITSTPAMVSTYHCYHDFCVGNIRATAGLVSSPIQITQFTCMDKRLPTHRQGVNRMYQYQEYPPGQGTLGTTPVCYSHRTKLGYQALQVSCCPSPP